LPKKPPLPAIKIFLYPPAQAEILANLSSVVQADVAAKILRLSGKTQPEIVKMLDRRTEPKVYQWESSAPGGTLRIVFAWGKGCLWAIGAFVKVNDKEGERYMQRILPRAKVVKDWDENT
jgi:hypothetical protein